MNIFIRGELSVELENGFTVNSSIMELLFIVDEIGSLNAAAKKLGVSYSHSWNMLNKLNCQLGTPVVITRRGGAGGGIAKLTPEGKFLLRRYEVIRDKFSDILNGYEFSINY
ncbi:MAG: LysR family transcriptional regulator [Deltaproteobacteria bacterium]|nr:LysR family transcriptional regulator [Deltaproteobacteria bacterium]